MESRLKTFSRLFRCVRWSVCALVLVAGSLLPFSGSAASAECRLLTAVGPFADTHLLAIAVPVYRPGIWKIEGIEVSAGGLMSGARITPLISLGPAWRVPLRRRFVLSASISPTLVGSSRFQGRPLGGHFHFTSALALERRIHHRVSVALRIQHTSNASIRGTNPGLDMVGLTLRFTDR